MTFDATKIKVSHFNGKNYINWRQEIISVAGFMQGLHQKILIGSPTYAVDFNDGQGNTPNIGDKAFHLATGEEKIVGDRIRLPRPLITYTGRGRTTSTGGTVTFNKGVLDEALVKTQAQWDSDNASLVGIIQMYMEPAYRHLIGDETMATVIWDKIESALCRSD